MCPEDIYGKTPPEKNVPKRNNAIRIHDNVFNYGHIPLVPKMQERRATISPTAGFDKS